MADDLRAFIFQTPQIEEATAQSSSDQPDFGNVRGWIGLVASERGLRMLTLPVAEHAAALNILHGYYPDAAAWPDDVMLLDIAAAGAGLPGRRIARVHRDARPARVCAPPWRCGPRRTASPTARRAPTGWIAEQAGGGGAGIYQAVGSALGANPVPLIIPCHRVVGSDGSLTGYAGGVEMKERLLALESGQAAFPGSDGRSPSSSFVLRQLCVSQPSATSTATSSHSRRYWRISGRRNLTACSSPATSSISFPGAPEVVDLLRSLPCQIILGNAELYLALWGSSLWPEKWDLPRAGPGGLGAGAPGR